MKKWCVGIVMASLGFGTACSGDGTDGGTGGSATGGAATGGAGTGGSATGGAGTGGAATGGAATGGAATGGAATGGSDTGGTGGAGDSPLNAFCHDFGEDCTFGGTDRYLDEATCLTEAGDIQAENEDRFDCMVEHLGRVPSMGTDHCAHAHGASPCSETEFPPN